MNELNQFVVSRVLGSTMKHAKRPSFGPLGALHVQNQTLVQCPKRDEQISFLPQIEKEILRAFEETRRGFPLDRVLADPPLAEKFFRRCKQLGVDAPVHKIALRMLALRKSPQKKLRIAKRTTIEPHRNFSAYLFAAEMATAQIKYRYGASVDDILAYPKIGEEFDALAARLYPGLTPLDYRLAALRVRKSRYCKVEERPLFDSLSTHLAEKTLHRHESLDQIDLDKFQGLSTIISLVEEARTIRYLYITQTNDAIKTLRPFTRQETFVAIGNSFWTPSLSSIHVYTYDISGSFRKAPQSLWAKKLIHEKAPIFNMPIDTKP